MKSKWITIGVFAFVAVLSGCATVIKGSSQSINFSSEPQGADVIIDGNLMGKTPTIVTLKKNKYKSAIIKKEGYESATIMLKTAYDPISLINVFWDLSTTDLITGNAYEYEPNSYTVKLTKEEGHSSKK